MSDHSTLVHIPISDVIQKKEEMGLKFFRECINKTNQFSAQYILNKLLRNYTDHVNELKQAVQEIPIEEVNQNLVTDLEERFSFKDLCMEFDLSTLTFIEAAKIVIRMAERDIDFYKYFIEGEFNQPTQQALKRIVVQKTAYMDRLKDEYARLGYNR